MRTPALAGVLGLVAVAAQADSLEVYSVATADSFAKFGQPGGVGDEIFWNSELQDRAGTRVGSNAGACVRLDAAGAHLCTFIVRHDGHGILTFFGVQEPEPAPSEIAITGGTGAYQGATGRVVSTPVEDRARFRYLIDYQLPGP
jgi:hypothetical protein